MGIMKKMIFAALLALAILAAGCTQPAAPTGGQQNQTVVPNNGAAPMAASVTISGFSFQPGTVTVAKGATVTWTNQDPVAHTVTGADFDSGSVEQGKTYSHVFDKAGTYDYHCAIHPSMKGTIIVQ
jgi:plastocyanin